MKLFIQHSWTLISRHFTSTKLCNSQRIYLFFCSFKFVCLCCCIFYPSKFDWRLVLTNPKDCSWVGGLHSCQQRGPVFRYRCTSHTFRLPNMCRRCTNQPSSKWSLCWEAVFPSRPHSSSTFPVYVFSVYISRPFYLKECPRKAAHTLKTNTVISLWVAKKTTDKNQWQH